MYWDLPLRLRIDATFDSAAAARMEDTAEKASGWCYMYSCWLA